MMDAEHDDSLPPHDACGALVVPARNRKVELTRGHITRMLLTAIIYPVIYLPRRENLP